MNKHAKPAVPLPDSRLQRARHALYDVLEHGAIGHRAGLIVSRLIIALIIASLVAITLETVPALQARFGTLFASIETIAVLVFTIEYILRLWVAVEHAPDDHLSAAAARLKFAI